MKSYVLVTFLFAFLLPDTAVLGLLQQQDIHPRLNFIENGEIQKVFFAPKEHQHELKRSYEGHALLRFSDPLTVVPLLETLSNFSVDVWRYGPDFADVLVRPDVFSKLIKNPDIKFNVLTSNIQRHIDVEEEYLNKMEAKEPTDPNDWFQSYHRYDKIVAWFKELAEAHPDLVEFFDSIGKTYEGRDIIAIKITNRNSEVHNKNQYWIQANQHAREWVGGAVAQYTAHHLVDMFRKDEEITALLTQSEFIIVPCSNPDGYEYTWVKDRLWRKNRRMNGRLSYGVDLNRNWDANWGHGGSSKFPSSETYQGPKANSEPEVQALSSFFLQHTRIVAAVDLHSYSQLILRPIGWTKVPPPHEKEHKQVCGEMAEIIQNVHGKTYVSEPSIALYPTTGSASDWFYLQKRQGENCPLEGLKKHKPDTCPAFSSYGITIELRPSPEWWGPGFVLPPDEIIPTAEEVVPALIHYFSFAAKNVLWEKEK